MPDELSPRNVSPESDRLSTEEAKDILRGLRKASEAYPDGTVSDIARTLAEWFASRDILTSAQSAIVWYGPSTAELRSRERLLALQVWTDETNKLFAIRRNWTTMQIRREAWSKLTPEQRDIIWNGDSIPDGTLFR